MDANLDLDLTPISGQEKHALRLIFMKIWSRDYIMKSLSEDYLKTNYKYAT